MVGKGRDSKGRDSKGRDSKGIDSKKIDSKKDENNSNSESENDSTINDSTINDKNKEKGLGEKLIEQIKFHNEFTKETNILVKELKEERKNLYEQKYINIDSLKTMLHSYLTENNLKIYKGYRLDNLLPKEELKEIKLEKKINKLKCDIQSSIPELNEEIVDKIINVIN